ncbi:MAG: acyl carrier protein [Clostridiales bacterium]|jgi:acyl carrier protein|nr:acyl carrier protein [Clostridiales bacterium]HOA34394.1 acyl carrier protein [Clostridiales bacterium]HOJ36435.1 acyl carrier protein [Clostridiales bacterium]HOL79227.1 acyl carrier protein [Clostridiales bacterium]HPP67564.1 acyl carrier protein [Clostridiales bacterium]
MIDRIKELICEFVKVNPKDLNEETNLRSDLGLSSLDLVNLAVAIENEYGTVISDREIAGIATIGDIIAYLNK